MTHDLGTAVDRSVRSAVDELRPDPVLLLRGVESRRQGRARTARWRAAGAMAAAAAATAAVVLVVPLLTGVQPTPQPADPPVPPGKQAVSWHGVEVLVPVDWKIGDQRCGTAQSDTVLRPGIVNSCLPPAVPGLTVVEFHALSPDQRTRAAQVAAVATDPVEVSGVRALRGSRPLDDEPGVQRVLVLPSEDVVVSVRSPEPARADALLDDVRVVAVDAAGCRSRIPHAQPTQPAAREGAGSSLVPGTPMTASLCRYGGLRLEASRRLDREQVRDLQRRLDALPTGRSGRIPPEEISDDYCARIDDDVDLLDVDYDEGPAVQVYIKAQGCTDRSPTNGSTTRRLTVSLPSTLSRLLHGWPIDDDLDRTQQRPQPAPELGYVQLPDNPAVPAQRADLLAGTDGSDDPQLLGATAADGRRCLLLSARSGDLRTVECRQQTADDAPVGGFDTDSGDRRVLLAAVGERVRSVRVLAGGEQVAVWATWGGGSRYDQRRYVLGLLPAGVENAELVGLDAAGFEVGRAVPDRLSA
ncbi:MAG: hypothetical protein WD794_13730 [Mycobacteriales bacterium]